jgi:hypothetical protein
MKSSKLERAKIFLPFDALKGFQEALREKEKVLVPKKIWDPMSVKYREEQTRITK